MTVHLYNTLSRSKEAFVPLREGEVHMYTCGPTVHDYAHIGNFRAFVWEDLLRRYLEFKGFRVTQVMNITDVDDKTIQKAKAQGVSLEEYTEHLTKAFFEDIEVLNIKAAEHYPRATGHIPQMVRLIQRLEEQGLAYRSDGSVYYDISKFPRYGRLSGMDPAGLQPGARVDSDSYEKEDARDFVLWKAAKPDEPSWETPVGVGRPGWHIECSAMSMHYLGETFDIHTGGVDNIFPHHENEIAQSEGATGKLFVRYWLHCAHLVVEGQKMAKSLGNFYTLRDILDRGYPPRAVRYLLLATHYRSPLNFTFQGVTGADAAIDRLQSLHWRLVDHQAGGGSDPAVAEETDRALGRFEAALDDDLNISQALSHIFEWVRWVNGRLDSGSVAPGDREALFHALTRINSVLAVLETERALPEEIEELIELRREARRVGNFSRADEIREQLRAMGIQLEDTPEGVRWKPISEVETEVCGD